MGCNCTKIKDLPTCLLYLIIGRLELTDQSVRVYFTNTSNGHVITVTGNSDADGEVTVTLDDLPENFFSPNYAYEIHITGVNTGPGSHEPITMGDAYLGTEITTDCLSAKFFRVEDGSLEAVYYTTIIAELA